jgi:hypothetical protein
MSSVDLIERPPATEEETELDLVAHELGSAPFRFPVAECGGCTCEVSVECECETCEFCPACNGGPGLCACDVPCVCEARG